MLIPYITGGLAVLCVVLAIELVKAHRKPNELVNWKEENARLHSAQERMYQDRQRAVRALQAAIITYGCIETPDHPDDTYNIPTKCLELPTALFDDLSGFDDIDKTGKETWINNWHKSIHVQGHHQAGGFSVIQFRVRDPLCVSRAKELLKARQAAKEKGQYI